MAVLHLVRLHPEQRILGRRVRPQPPAHHPVAAQHRQPGHPEGARRRGAGPAKPRSRAHGVLRDVQHATRNSAEIPIHGCNTGCFNAIQADTATSTNPTSFAPYWEVFTGSSLVMTTELTRQGPRSQGILAYSQATDPTSPWFANLTRLYSRKRWVTMLYTPAQLRTDHRARTLTLVIP